MNWRESGGKKGMLNRGWRINGGLKDFKKQRDFNIFYVKNLGEYLSTKKIYISIKCFFLWDTDENSTL